MINSSALCTPSYFPAQVKSDINKDKRISSVNIELKNVVPDDLSNGHYTIGAAYKYTFLKGNEKDYCFIKVCDSLLSFAFEPDSQLETIGPYSFYNCNKLQIINLSSCSKLRAIGSYAFSKCASVTSLELPEGLTTIGQFSFSYISTIQSVFIPYSVESILTSAFGACKGLSEVIFAPNCKLSDLSDTTFISTSLKSIQIPSSTTKFRGSAFNQVTTLESITIEDDNTVLDGDGKAVYNKQRTIIYYYASATTGTFEIPSTVTTIEWGCFISSQLSNIIIPDSVTLISAWTFVRTPNLKSIKLPPNITQLYQNTFYISGLTNITIPNKVTKIGASCFEQCRNLEFIFLPDSLTDLGGNVIKDSNAKFVFSNESNFQITDDLLLMDKSETFVTMFYSTDITSVTIPYTVKTIKRGAFQNKVNLKTANCNGDSQLESIENDAFNGCKSLVSFFEFPLIKNIGMRAFYGTNINHSIVFGVNLYALYEQAFYSCQKIPSIEFKSNVALRIDKEVFYQCVMISSIKFSCTSDVTLGDSVFDGLGKIDYLFIPSYIKSVGILCFRGCSFSTVEFENNEFFPGYIPYGTFKDCTNLWNITIPSNVSSIDGQSLSGTNIKTLIIPDSVTELGRQCMKGCCNLTTVTISSNSLLSTINYGVFDGCRQFSTLTPFTSNFFVTDSNALYNIGKTKMIVYPPASPNKFFSLAYTVTSLAESSFIGCINLQSIMIPDSTVRSIGSSAFEGCVNLKYINLPLCVEIIGENAFLGCRSLICGSIHYENKTSSFRRQLVLSGASPSSLHECKFETCRSTYYSDYKYLLIAVFILI